MKRFIPLGQFSVDDVEFSMTHSRYLDATEIQLNNKYGSTTHIVSNQAIQDLSEQDIVRNLINRHNDLFKNDPSYQHPGPTNKELDENPALKNAWEQYMITRKLIGR